MADPARIRLGRIRCLVQAVEAMQKEEPLPEPLCYIPLRLNLECKPEEIVELYEKPDLTSTVLNKLGAAKTHQLVVKGRSHFNKDGGWFQMISPHENTWILVQPSEKTIKVSTSMLTIKSMSFFLLQAKFKIIKSDDKELLNWMDAVEQICSLQISRSALSDLSHAEDVQKLQQPLPGWSMEADEELARFLVEQCSNSLSSDGTARGNEYLTRIEASSADVSNNIIILYLFIISVYFIVRNCTLD